MSKLFPANRLATLVITLGMWMAVSSGVKADDTFALAIGSMDHLIVFGPKGEQVADVPIPTIAKSVSVGNTIFQISYGRDANDLLTAVLTPDSAQPQDLHFSVLDKHIDADKEAVVTLTFADARHVTIDPGYIGSVVVNSRNVRHHELADDVYAPRPHASSPTPVHLTSTSNSDTAPTPRLVADLTPRDIAPSQAPAPSSPSPTESSPDPEPTPTQTPASAGAGVQKLFWAEPVTPRHEPPPAVGINEMKLVDVHGSVTVKTTDGNSVPGQNGMVLPSGSTVSTADNASAAVFMGGVNSARFLPNRQASVSQDLNGSVRKTNIDLSKGTVFCRVGRRDGEKQDYEVNTPQGVAAARGTELAVALVKINGVSYTVCFTKTGKVQLTDKKSGQRYDVTPQGIKQVAGCSIPALSPNVEKTVLLTALTALQPFNTDMKALAAAIKAGTASAADVAYYKENSDLIDQTTELFDALTNTLAGSILGSNASATTTVDNGNGTSTTTTTTTGADGAITRVSTTTDNTTGQIVKIVKTVQTANDDGTYTTTTTTTDAQGNTTTSTTTTTNNGVTTTTPPAPSTPPATGTLNTTLDLSPF